MIRSTRITATHHARLLLVLMFLVPASVRAEDISRYYSSVPSLRPLFRSVVSAASRSTALVVCDGEAVALGTIVDTDGYIATKASELHGAITCRLHDGRELPARLMKSSAEYDLALLKVNADNLTPIRWGDAAAAQVGRWVATAGIDDLPVAIGVVSVGRRLITSRDVVLGVHLADEDGVVRVTRVVEGSGAAKAGMRAGDIVMAIAGASTPTRNDLVAIITRHGEGDKVAVTVQRDGRMLELLATLGSRPRSAPSRSDIMNRMGGALSQRKSGFPAAIQHDTVLQPRDCGGPLVDIDGNAIGINIARAGRTESYALPADVVIELINQLKGDTTPAPERQLADIKG